jgi:hypothetical protein
MNERIQEIADQAAKWAQKANWSIDLKFGDRPYSELYNEKFAELIVRECADVALREDHDPYECILNHFGVKE